MTHHARYSMAKAILERRGKVRPGMVCDKADYDEADADGMAALRALAACEPSEGMRAAGLLALADTDAETWNDKERSLHTEHESNAVWRAMLAELVKECERDG